MFNLPGTYNLQLITSTTFGCADTARHSIVINPVPFITASSSLTLCLGSSANLNATGAANFQWTPTSGLSCNTCPNPIATPVVTTPYVVSGTNSSGCTGTDTVIITVIQP